MEIHTTLSALGRFLSVTQANYSGIISIANYVLSKAENIHVNLEDEKEKIIAQITKLQELSEDISLKVAKYHEALISAENYEAMCEDMYYSARDDDDVDWDYISSLRDNWDDARRDVSVLNKKVYSATSISSSILSNIEQLENILKATNRIIEASNNNVYEIKKHLSLLVDEASYNMNSVKGLIDSVEAYLSSMEFVSVENVYLSEIEFNAGTSFPSGFTGRSGSISSKEIQKKTATIYKVAKEDMKKIMPHKKQSLLFERYSPYYGPIKQMLLNTMMCMGPGFQQFMLECISDVIFVRSKNAFIYDTNNKNGRTLRIIGLDITNEYLPTLLYIHVSHNLMHGKYINEKMRMDQLVAKELKRDVLKTNSKLFKIFQSVKYDKLKAGKTRSLTNVSFDLSSKFFGNCLKLYIEKDIETLTGIKCAFPESFAMFAELLDRTIKWK